MLRKLWGWGFIAVVNFLPKCNNFFFKKRRSLVKNKIWKVYLLSLMWCLSRSLQKISKVIHFPLMLRFKVCLLEFFHKSPIKSFTVQKRFHLLINIRFLFSGNEGIPIIFSKISVLEHFFLYNTQKN